jgi:MFS family permease
MFEQLVDVIVIDLLRCPFPRSGQTAEDYGRHAHHPITRSSPAYTYFDLLAGCGTSVLINLCITVALPMSLSSAELRSGSSPIHGSGSVVATSWLGMFFSIMGMYLFGTERFLDGKAPFYLFALLLLAGNAVFLLAELHAWPLDVLIGARFLMALGFGASFAVKRRAALEVQASRRELHFMHIALCNTLGAAGGPLIAGIAAYCLPSGARLWPPLLMVVLALAFLALVASTPIDAPIGSLIGGGGFSSQHPNGNAAPIPPAGASHATVFGPPSGTVSRGVPTAAKETTPLKAPAQVPSAFEQPGAVGLGGAIRPRASSSMGESFVVQSTMLAFVVGRNFLQGAFE